MDSFGLVGEKLTHSLSPEIHNRIFKELKIRESYGLFSVRKENFNNVVIWLRSKGIKGFNVTIPYKEEIMDQLDIISPEARAIGAVNTVFFKGDKALGYNTDYYGFGKTIIKENIDTLGKTCYILGSGGAAKAIAQYVSDNHGDIIIVSRDIKKAKMKFNNYKIMEYESFENISQGDLIINTTPCGMYPNIETMAVEENVIGKFKVAIDIVYNPIETRFLKVARNMGLKSVNGLHMLVGQGLKAEEIWQGVNLSHTLEEKIYFELENILKSFKE